MPGAQLPSRALRIARLILVPKHGGPRDHGEILDARYYSDCLQSHIEHFELAQDEGLGLTEAKEGKQLGVELDLDGLLRMDTATLFDTLSKGVGGGFLSPNEARKKIDQKPLKGGHTVYLQQQNFSLEALDQRDRNDPFAKPAPKPEPKPDDDDDGDAAAEELSAARLVFKQKMRAA